MTIETEGQRTELSPYVELWDLDLTVHGGVVYYFVKGSFEDEDVSFGGQVYTPFDFEAEGFEWSGEGSPPTPIIRLSGSTMAITDLINSFDDLVGAKVTRTRTFKKFLDNQTDEDPDEYYSKDVYVINQKKTENKYMVEFELASKMDQQNLTLPKGKIVPYCQWAYRKYNGSTFDYAPIDIRCPFAGTTYFDENNVSTTAGNDKCSHTVAGCKARFGENAVLPFYGFPGTSRPTL